jgi:hypothetical protein
MNIREMIDKVKNVLTEGVRPYFDFDEWIKKQREHLGDSAEEYNVSVENDEIKFAPVISSTKITPFYLGVKRNCKNRTYNEKEWSFDDFIKLFKGKPPEKYNVSVVSGLIEDNKFISDLPISNSEDLNRNRLHLLFKNNKKAIYIPRYCNE